MVVFENTESVRCPENMECTANRVLIAKYIRREVRGDSAVFVYDLEVYTKDEYIRKQKADIDYLAMCAGVDMEV